jgi:integrase
MHNAFSVWTRPALSTKIHESFVGWEVGWQTVHEFDGRFVSRTLMREANKLSAVKVNRLKTPGRYCDGLGLWLQVSETGTKAWIFRYTRHGQARHMGLGALHTVSLAEARERARQARQVLLDGGDPLEIKRKQRDEARAESAERILFKDAAQRFLDLHENTWKNAKHRDQWRNTLRDYAYPYLGSRPISAIDGALITEALASIWTKKPETARRVKQRIERVIQWVRDGTPLPSPGASRRVRHHPAMSFAELPAFMEELRDRDGISARALEFAILTAARTSEVIGAKWSEIDLDAGVWTVPAERMKGAKEHQVPLSKRAIAILEDLPRERGGYLFPGAKTKAPLSNMAMLELLRGMDSNGFTVHGFRSTFRDWAGDRTNYAREVIEHALAHRIKDKAEASYRRSNALEKRRRLMEAWAKYCESPAAGQVVSMHG